VRPTFREKLLKAEVALTFRDVIILPGYSEVEPGEVDLTTRVTGNFELKAPLVSSPMDTVTGSRMAIEMARLGGLGVIHRNMPVERQVEEVRRVKEAEVPEGGAASLGSDGRLLAAAAISPYDLERARALDRYADILVTDVAHFHTRNVIEATRRLVREVSADVVVGNIGTYEAAVDVITRIEDVSAVRVGMASGSICITARVTGVAAPTLYAVASVADALREHGADVPVIADGGMKSPGDVAKALAVGASAAMSGYLFAGTEEAEGAVVRVGGQLYKRYRGMGTRAAREEMRAFGRYSISTKDVEEGVEGLVPYRGKLADVFRELVAALRASLGYVGARDIREFWGKAKLALVTPLGHGEVEYTYVLQVEGQGGQAPQMSSPLGSGVTHH